MGRPKNWPPVINQHSGKDRVWWNGKWHHLGPTGSKEAKAEYGRLIGLWSLDPTSVGRRASDYLVVELCRDYLKSPDAPPSGDQRNRFVRAVEFLAELHLQTTVEDFRPTDLDAWQLWLCQLADAQGRQRLNRTSVSEMVGCVRAIWKWGVRREKVDESRYSALLTVPGPKYGQVREPVPRQAARIEDVEATIPHLRKPTAAMVRVQLLTGARPDEVCSMRPCEIHRGGVVDLPGGVGRFDLDALGVWVYVPDQHKNKHRGKSKFIVLGPKCQDVLRPFLDRDPEAFCFSPAEAVEEWKDELRANRIGQGSKKKPVGKPKRKPGLRYTSKSYAEAVERAAKRAGVRYWPPYSFRHYVAAEVDFQRGCDDAQAVLGHEQQSTTRDYAKRNVRRAAEVARTMG